MRYFASKTSGNPGDERLEEPKEEEYHDDTDTPIEGESDISDVLEKLPVLRSIYGEGIRLLRVLASPSLRFGRIGKLPSRHLYVDVLGYLPLSLKRAEALGEGKQIFCIRELDILENV